MTFRIQSLSLQPLSLPPHPSPPSPSPSSFDPSISKPTKQKPPLSLSHLPNTPISDPGLLFRRKILYLESLKINPQRALHRNPNFRSAPLETLQSVEHFLVSAGIPRKSLGRIFGMVPQLLTADPISDLCPVLDFLVDEVGIEVSEVPRSVLACPRLLASSVAGRLRPTLWFLREMGFVGSQAIRSQTTLLLVSCVEGTILPKLEFLEGLGIGRVEVERMVLRMPRLLTYSVKDNFAPKAKYFLEEMGGNVCELQRFPQYFAFSLENKIKPRHRSLAEHGLSLPLSRMLLASEGEFNARVMDMWLDSVNVR